MSEMFENAKRLEVSRKGVYGKCNLTKSRIKANFRDNKTKLLDT